MINMERSAFEDYQLSQIGGSQIVAPDFVNVDKIEDYAYTSRWAARFQRNLRCRIVGREVGDERE